MECGGLHTFPLFFPILFTLKNPKSGCDRVNAYEVNVYELFVAFFLCQNIITAQYCK